MAEAVAGHTLAVAIGCKNRLPDSRSGKKIRKNTVYQPIDILKCISAPNPLLVISGRGSDRKVVALVAIPRDHRSFVMNQ